MSQALRLVWDSGDLLGPPRIERAVVTPQPGLIPVWLKHMPDEVKRAIAARYELGELPERIAADYGLDLAFVTWVLACPDEEGA